MTLALIIVGPPGGGKHDLAHALSVEFACPHIDAGRIVSELRDPEDSELALRHEVQNQIEAAALAHEVLVIESFPRNLAQFCTLESMPDLHTSYIAAVSELQTCVRRIASRGRVADHPDAIALSMRCWIEQTMPMLEYVPTLVLDGSTHDTEHMLSRVLRTYEHKLNGARR